MGDSQYQQYAPAMPTVVLRGSDLELWLVLGLLSIACGVLAYFVHLSLVRELSPVQTLKSLELHESLQIGNTRLTFVNKGTASVPETATVTQIVTPVTFLNVAPVPPVITVSPLVASDDEYSDLKYRITDVSRSGFHIVSNSAAFTTPLQYTWIALA